MVPATQKTKILTCDAWLGRKAQRKEMPKFMAQIPPHPHPPKKPERSGVDQSASWWKKQKDLWNTKQTVTDQKEHNQAYPTRARRLKSFNKKATGQLATLWASQENPIQRSGAFEQGPKAPSLTTPMLAHITPPWPPITNTTSSSRAQTPWRPE